MRVAKTVVLLLLAAVPRLFAQPDIVATVGEPVGTFPRWEERVLHQLTNRARVAPATVLFTDDPLVAQSTVIKSVHLTELRTAVNAMRAAVGLPPGGYTDSGAPGVPVKAVHITELRTALDAARSALGVSTGGYTDSSLTAGVTPVRAVHFQELRDRTK